MLLPGLYICLVALRFTLTCLFALRRVAKLETAKDSLDSRQFTVEPSDRMGFTFADQVTRLMDITLEIREHSNLPTR